MQVPMNLVDEKQALYYKMDGVQNGILDESNRGHESVPVDNFVEEPIVQNIKIAGSSEDEN